MNNSFESKFEHIKETTREDVMQAYEQFVKNGILNPDDLDLEDPEVIRANELFFKWVKEGDEKAEGNRELEHRFNIEKTIFYVNCGFTDEVYLEDVLSQLNQDDDDIVEDINDPESVETRRLFNEAVAKVEGKVKELLSAKI